MEWLSCIASAIGRYLVCRAVDQLSYPCCFNNFVEELQKQEDKLTTTIDSVEDLVKHANKQAIKNADVFDGWLKEANALKNNVEDLLKKARTNKSYCLWHCPNWIWQYGVGKKLEKKKVDIENCIEEGNKYIQLEHFATLPSGMPDFPFEKCLEFDSRQSAYEQLMEALKDDKVAMIGFAVEVRRIQDKIASPQQFTFPENEVREKAQLLCKRLTKENRILVILDDVWEKLDFGAIGIPSNEHHRVCKVLVTTRSVNVCTLMDCQRKIPLSILTNEEAWALFQNQAHIFEGTSDSLKHLARLISHECKGLLVAIAVVASTLKGKAEVEWKVALDRLKNSKPVNIEKGLQNPYNCLQLSYDNLDNEEAKSLFLFCKILTSAFAMTGDDFVDKQIL
ncbi:probable disease resistance protein At4g27220 [Gastrolobium bilobum]|uniref:probable disease resistance protein At4g27220 n=1 Tax=Gastrolobium bilobum TaxID=150636 RepID=UPI002AB14737|nr:probable disease resistance protein At4g27220 [Gastrolobium bilobum]